MGIDYTIVCELESNVIRIVGNTFLIKDELKKEGAKWNPVKKSWDFQDRTEKFVKKLLKNIVEEYEEENDIIVSSFKDRKTNQKASKGGKAKELKKKKSENSPYKKIHSEYKKDWELKPFIDDAKELWNELMEKNGIRTQKPILVGAGVFVKLIPKNETLAEWVLIIDFKDPSLYEYAEKVKEWLEQRKVPVKVEKGYEMDMKTI